MKLKHGLNLASALHIELNLALPYKLNLISPDGKVQAAPRQVSEGIIASAITSLYPQTMPKTDGKIWAGIQDKLFEDGNTLYLNSTEFEWLARQLDKWEPPALFASRYWTLMSEVERVKKGPAPQDSRGEEETPA